MKKFLIWIISVVAIVIVADVCVGVFSDWYVKNNDLGGDYTSFEYMLNDFDEKGLVVGSSVALNGLDTKQMSDSLGIEWYNGAYNAQDLPFVITLLNTVISANKPEHIALGIRPSELLGHGYGRRYNFLTPFYGMGYPEIDKGLEEANPDTKLLLKSNLYRMNTIWFRILLYRFINPNEAGEKGFIAKPIPSKYPHKLRVESHDSVSAERVAQFKEIIDICRDNGVELTVFFTPHYYDVAATPETVRVVDSICAANGVTLYNDLSNNAFISDSTYFYDNAHLNKEGARKYTEMFINYLKERP